MASEAQLQDIEKRVGKVVAKVLKPRGIAESEITPEAEFVKHLKAHSIDMYSMIVAIEEEFDLGEIPDEDAENITTVQDVIDYVADKIDA